MKKATFIIGLPDSRTVLVSGLRPDGSLAYSWPGNTDFPDNLTLPDIHKELMPVLWFKDPARHLAKPDIVINCINDADQSAESLKRAMGIVDLIQRKWPQIPVLNHPARIEATTRDRIYQTFKDLPGLDLPRTVKIHAHGCDDVLRQAKEQGIGFPFLIRRCGSHNSQNLSLIASPADRDRLERHAYDGSAFYLSRFVDSRTPDTGLYHKARLVMIGGHAYPRHYMSSETWMVSDMHTRFMATREDTKTAEARFIRDWQHMISPAALASLRTIHARIGLDYLGFDFAIKPDGSLLIFEINPAQNTFIRLNYTDFPYMEAVQQSILDAFNALVATMIEAANTSTPREATRNLSVS